MSSDCPKDRKLEDQLGNLDGMVVVSSRFHEFLKAKDLGSVEYLPVSIINHKGRAVARDYVIVHPYRVVDCIDTGSSELSWHPIAKDRISGCDELVLHDDVLSSDDIVVRPRHLELRVLVREDLAGEIEDAGFTGVDLTAIDEFAY